jgi:hypothetical protein
MRDSNDFEHKMFSSTPDQSIFVVQPLATSKSLFMDEDEHIINNQLELQIDSYNKLKKSSKLIASSTDMLTDKDEDESILDSIK